MIARKVIAGGVAPLMLSACVNQFSVHDPQSGVVGRGEVTDFLKSIRCELKTFYDANRINQIAYVSAIKRSQSVSQAEADRIRAAAVVNYPHFMIDDKLVGGAYLYLKVVDTVGVGTGDINLTQKRIPDPLSSVSTSITPIVNSQNTYDMNYSFAIDQGKGLSDGPGDETDPFRCYAVASSRLNPVELAFGGGDTSSITNFYRIYLNGSEPLAGWLIRNSRDLWSTYAAKSSADSFEQFYPLQMNYSFTILFTAGLGARYSLISPVWSPAQVGGGVSSAQTSQIALYFNGANAAVALSAKNGTGELTKYDSEENRQAIARLGSEATRLQQAAADQKNIVNRFDEAARAAEKFTTELDRSATDPTIKGLVETKKRDAANERQKATDARTDLARIQDQLKRTIEKRNTLSRSGGIGTGSVYGLEGARLKYPLAVPLPQVYVPQ